MEIVLNGKPRHVAAESTVEDLINSLGVERRGLAVEVNLQLVPQRQHAQHRLAAGDRVELVTLVGGG